MHLNTYITHKQVRYEIYWTTVGAKHVLDNFCKDIAGGPHYELDHVAIVRLLKTARFVSPVPRDPRPHIHVCLTGWQGKVYETYVYLVPELEGRPARCVVSSSYVTNKQQYRSLFA